jgi:hypothetical protein
MWILRYREELFNVVFAYSQLGGIQPENYSILSAAVKKEFTVHREKQSTRLMFFYIEILYRFKTCLNGAVSLKMSSEK